MDKLDLVGRGNQFRLQMFVDLLFPQLLRIEQTNHMLHLCLSIYISTVSIHLRYFKERYTVYCVIYLIHTFL